MQLTKGAIGNLINRYKAVLKKCHLMNTFGSLAVAGMLVMGGAGVAGAAGAAIQHTSGVHDYSGENISYTASGDAITANGTDTRNNPQINIGNSDTQSIAINAGGGIFSLKSGHITLTSKEVTLISTDTSGSYSALWAQNNSTDINGIPVEERASITINAENTNIKAENSAIVAMSNGIIEINGNLHVEAQNALLARGDAIISLNKSGESTVGIDGNINFNYDKPTSGTGVNATIDITLNGADSYWNGNTLISWNGTPSDPSKLDVSEMTLTVKDGATWTPTAISNSESQKYTALNNLTLDGGIVDVNKGVAITIENIGGKGAITNAGSVTIEQGTIEGPITFEKGEAKADNMVTVDRDGKTTLRGGVAGSGTIDKLAIAEDGKTTITNAKLSGHEGRALWNNGTLTVNGGSFEGNKANVAGAIYNAADAELTVDGVTFASNSSAIAGAINNRDGTVTITDSTFKGNDAGKSMGGAIRNDSGDIQKNGTITITGSTFEDNTAGNGGAVWNGSNGKVKITDSTFKGNTAVAEGGLGQGGAITNADQMTITGGSFANNTANYSGGAIYNGAHAAPGQTSLTIDGTTFTGNSVTADFSTTPNDNIAGGAIFNDTNAKLDVKNATFTDNTSSLKGGAIFNRDGTVTITNSTFKGNSVPKSAGGAVLNESGNTGIRGTITITGSTFEGNKAGNGGAVWNGSNGKVEIADSTFKGNTALAEGGIGQGGAITNADQMTITGSTFEGNQAGKIGGAIFNAASGKLDFNGTNTFTNNTAAGKANDIYNAGTITVAGGTTTLGSGYSQDAGSLTVQGGAALESLGTMEISGGSVAFKDNSLFAVNGNALTGDNAAITVNGGTLEVENKARLRIDNAKNGQTYTIVNNQTGTEQGKWSDGNIEASTDLLTPTMDENGNVTFKRDKDASDVFTGMDSNTAAMLNTLIDKGLNNVDSDQMGVRFLSRATDNRFLGMDKKAAAESIESAARIAFAGAAPQMTKMASDAGTNAVVNRLGFANPADGAQAMDAEGKIVDRNTTGFALWIAPLWQSQHGWGLDAGNMDYGFNGNLGGVSLGADYTFENAIRAGITFNIGGGYAESSGGDLSSTENRMNFWGLGAYAGWNYENFGVMADVSYTSTWNQLKQDLDSRLGMGNKLEADVQASAISAGLRAEYLLQTSAMDIIPHIGVRYMSLNTWGYDVDTHGGTVLEGDSLHQDIWTFPIGVTFTKDFALDSGWSFKPSLDFTVIPAAGDIKAKHDVHFTGLPGTYEVETQMMDYLTWQGGVGLELANDNMSIGVNYTLQAGQHTTGHGVFGSFRYEF